MPISSPIISRALRDISSCGGRGWGGATHRRAYAALGAGGGVLPSLCLAGFFSGERLLRGAAGGGCAMAGGGGSGRGGAIMGYYSMERHSFAHCISLRRAQGSRQGGGHVVLRNYIPRGFTWSLFLLVLSAHASFPLPSFLPPSIHPRHLALIRAGIGTLSSARTLSHLGPRKV